MRLSDAVVGPLALMFAVGTCSAAAAQSTDIRKCDDYYAMVSACLPRMCEAERAVIELELSFSRETLQKVVELKGRAAAAQACEQDILKELQDDPYGCYESDRTKAGLPKSVVRDVRVQPAATSVVISFKVAPERSFDGAWQVAIGSEDQQPQVRYVVSQSAGVFALNTAVDRPVAPTGAKEASQAPQPFRLDPGVSYCFAITSSTGGQRRGSFTTSPER